MGFIPAMVVLVVRTVVNHREVFSLGHQAKVAILGHSNLLDRVECVGLSMSIVFLTTLPKSLPIIR